jgi:hypothetical protein
VLGRKAKKMTEGGCAVSYGVELVGVSVELGSDRGVCSEDELGRGIPLMDHV